MMLSDNASLTEKRNNGKRTAKGDPISKRSGKNTDCPVAQPYTVGLQLTFQILSELTYSK